MQRAIYFQHRWLPIVLVTPQLIIVLLFFYWPAIQALLWSFTLEKPFGGESDFVGFYNFTALFREPSLMHSLGSTLFFSVTTTILSIACALIFAIATSRKIKGQWIFRNVLVWPYAISAPVVGVTFSFLINPSIGAFSILNQIQPNLWQPSSNPIDAMIMIILATCWTQIPFFFILFLSALQNIPKDIQYAAAIDGAGPIRRFFDIQLPLMAPYLFFALITGLSENLTGSFAIIHTMTQGGPGGATDLLVHKIYVDGFIGLDFSASSTLSVLLMLLVIVFTTINFCFFQKRVHY